MNDRKYDEATARTIFEMMVWKLGESCVIREGGIFLNEEFRALRAMLIKVHRCRFSNVIRR